MSTRTLTLVLATMLGLGFGSNARASLPIAVSNISGTNIVFTPTGTGANINFTTATTGPLTGWGFQVTSNPAADANLVGSIGGTYNYLTANIVSNAGPPPSQTVDIGGSGTLTINDNGGTGGHDLTGTVDGFKLSYTVAHSSGALNLNALVNLTGITYGGTNSDLQALAAASNQGIVTVSFTFVQGKSSLSELAENGGSTSWSGTITGTPEPSSMALAGLGALGLIGYGVRRRKALAV